jgi:DNA-binding NarL/FixJ family response regulator
MSDAALAVLAGVRGAGLVITSTAQEPVLARLVEDLERVGPVDLWPKEDTSPLGSLSIEQCCLLDLLAEGRTLTQIARSLHVSRRTADRALASARAALGVATTAEAVLIVRAALSRSWHGPLTEARG